MSLLGSILSFAASFVFPVGEFNTDPTANPLTVDGQQAPLQVDENGSLRVAMQSAVLAAQGEPSNATQAWPTRLSDGVSVLSTVKAANTPPVAGDTGAVVDIRPGGVLPAAAAAADADSNATTASMLRARLASFNGASWDRVRSGVSALGTTLTGMLNVLPMAQFNTTPPTRTTGQVGLLEVDSGGRLLVDEPAPTKSSGAITPSDSTDVTALANVGLIVGVGGTLSFKLTGDSAATSVTVYPGQFVPGQFARVMAATTATVVGVSR